VGEDLKEVLSMVTRPKKYPELPFEFVVYPTTPPKTLLNEGLLLEPFDTPPDEPATPMLEGEYPATARPPYPNTPTEVGSVPARPNTAASQTDMPNGAGKLAKLVIGAAPFPLPITPTPKPLSVDP
jgi:hypothetical protein